jgi:hypothetical protein
MKTWILIAVIGLVLISGCATFKDWMSKTDTAKLTDDLRLLEQLLTEKQNSQQLYIPPNLGEALSRMKFKREF